MVPKSSGVVCLPNEKHRLLLVENRRARGGVVWWCWDFILGFKRDKLTVAFGSFMLSHKFFATHLVVVVKSEKVSERRVPYFSLNINDQSTAKRIHYIPIFVF